MARAGVSRKGYIVLGGAAALAVFGVAGWPVIQGAIIQGLGGASRTSVSGGAFLRDGEAGFVFTQFSYALGPDTQDTAHCPDGMASNMNEIFALTAEGQRRAGEDDEAYSERLDAGGAAASADEQGRNFCAHPEIAPRDPHARVMVSASARADGIDLDGKASRSKADRQSGHLDFTAPDGRKGIDNQFWRAVGCNRSFQKAGLSNEFQTTMYTGSWGVLIRLEGVDDIRNDDDVKVTIVANADPIRLSPARAALTYATYSMDDDPRFRAVTSGRIVEGVLTTDPVDVRFHQDVNGMYLERPLNAARIEATLSADGAMKGYLAGYTPVEALYDFQFGYRSATNGEGEPAPEGRRLGSANGAARVLGHTCQGVYQSLHRMADGNPDAKTGQFTSISTQYRFEAQPAFVIDAQPAAGSAT